jgi:hypothetical protein
MTCPACGSTAKPIITVAIARSTSAKPLWCTACHNYFDYRRWLAQEIGRGTTLAIVVGTEASSREPRRDVTVTIALTHHDPCGRRVDLAVTNVDLIGVRRTGWWKRDKQTA